MRLPFVSLFFGVRVVLTTDLVPSRFVPSVPFTDGTDELFISK